MSARTASTVAVIGDASRKRPATGSDSPSSLAVTKRHPTPGPFRERYGRAAGPVRSCASSLPALLAGAGAYAYAVRTTVAGVLLAAGDGSRFGRPKALVELNGQTLAERGVNLLRAGGAHPILVVTGAAPVELDGTDSVYNPAWRTGMGSSLRAALQALSAATDAGPTDGTAADAGATGSVDSADEAGADVGAVVVALADQPLVGAESVARLIAAYHDGATVAVATYGGQPRNPVLLARIAAATERA